MRALDLLPDLYFIRDFTVTQAGIMAASAMGGMKQGVKVIDFMHPASLPDGAARQGASWSAFRLESKAAEADFKVAMQMGLVSQHVFDCLTI